jgi:hypothetical protein
MSIPNPYASPQAPPVAYQAAVPAFKPIDKIEYMRAYHYVFESPNWTMNIVWGFLCLISTMVIPVVGQLVLIGYQFEVLEALLLTQGARYPDFNANRFADYLGRSIWPFLVALVLLIPMVIIFYGAVFCVALLVMAGAAIGGDNFGPVLAVVFGLFGFTLLVAMWIAAMGLLTPLVLRAGLMQDFAAAFDFGWAVDFLKKTWLEIVLVSLFLMATAFALSLVGFLALCIGMFAAQALVALAQSHLVYQLYMLYLSRGGAPVPAKAAVAVPLPMNKPM